MTDIYHERQSLMYCAIHAINNLLQSKAFTKQQFDEICYQLSDNYINPHKSILNIGNYDINIIIKALESKNFSVRWFDKRNSISKESINLDKSFGFIMNIPTDYTIGFVRLPLIKNRHWLAIRKINEKFYNLDSKISKPKLIGETGSADDLIEYLTNEMHGNNKELFIVVENNLEST